MDNSKELPSEADENEELDVCIVGSFWTSPYGGELYVDTDDSGKTPHFHIRNYQSGTSKNYGFLTGIEFRKSAYFHQQSVEDVLNDKEKEALIELLNSVVDRPKFKEAGITMWDMCRLLWDWNNSGNELPEELEMPDYTKLGGESQ
jgi:hypothetical protein